MKGTIFDRLQRGRMTRFEPVYYEQLASERRVIRYHKGRPIRRFERIAGRRAETLDALVYAHAARSAAPIQLDQRERDLASRTPPQQRQGVVKSAWMSR